MRLEKIILSIISIRWTRFFFFESPQLIAPPQDRQVYSCKGKMAYRKPLSNISNTHGKMPPPPPRPTMGKDVAVKKENLEDTGMSGNIEPEVMQKFTQKMAELTQENVELTQKNAELMQENVELMRKNAERTGGLGVSIEAAHTIS